MSELTMSTREIAEITEKRHSNVTRDVERMLEVLSLDVLNFEHIYLDESNREQREYILPRNLTFTLIGGYTVPLRLRIVNRWQELEQAERDAPIKALVERPKSEIFADRTTTGISVVNRYVNLRIEMQICTSNPVRESA